MLQQFLLLLSYPLSAGETSGSSNELNAVPIFPEKRCHMHLNIFLGNGGISVYAPVSS